MWSMTQNLVRVRVLPLGTRILGTQSPPYLPPFKSFDMGLNIVGLKKSQIIKSDMCFFRYYIQLSLFV